MIDNFLITLSIFNPPMIFLVYVCMQNTFSTISSNIILANMYFVLYGIVISLCYV